MNSLCTIEFGWYYCYIGLLIIVKVVWNSCSKGINHNQYKAIERSPFFKCLRPNSVLLRVSTTSFDFDDMDRIWRRRCSTISLYPGVPRIK